jgi:hypothetical protein
MLRLGYPPFSLSLPNTITNLTTGCQGPPPGGLLYFSDRIGEIHRWAPPKKTVLIEVQGRFRGARLTRLCHC